MLRIKFRGKEFLLVDADCLEDGGAIATKEQYENFKLGFAHLGGKKDRDFYPFRRVPDGKVYRFGKEIGTIKDIVVLGGEK